MPLACPVAQGQCARVPIPRRGQMFPQAWRVSGHGSRTSPTASASSAAEGGAKLTLADASSSR